jgi:hypothetical protein
MTGGVDPTTIAAAAAGAVMRDVLVYVIDQMSERQGKAATTALRSHFMAIGTNLTR